MCWCGTRISYDFEGQNKPRIQPPSVMFADVACRTARVLPHVAALVCLSASFEAPRVLAAKYVAANSKYLQRTHHCSFWITKYFMKYPVGVLFPWLHEQRTTSRTFDPSHAHDRTLLLKLEKEAKTKRWNTQTLLLSFCFLFFTQLLYICYPLI